MWYPVFPSHQRNLHLSYIILPRLFEFLKNDLFSGYLHIIASEYEYFVFFDQGEILNVLKKDLKSKKFETMDLTEMEGEVADDILNIFHLPEETSFYWSNIIKAEILYPNLSSEFSNLIKLINKIKKEKVTGFIEIISQDNEKSFIYIMDGDILGTSCSWNKWVFEEGDRKISEITNKAINAVFNVYSIDLNKMSNKKEINKEEIIDLFQKLFSLVEKKVNSKNFSITWRQIALEISDKYPFLDPFANQFEYVNSTITIKGKIFSEELLNGLKELFESLVARLGVKNKIMSEIEQFEEEDKKLLTYLGLKK